MFTTISVKSVFLEHFYYYICIRQLKVKHLILYDYENKINDIGSYDGCFYGQLQFNGSEYSGCTGTETCKAETYTGTDDGQTCEDDGEKTCDGRCNSYDATAAKFAPLYKEYLQAMKDCRPVVDKETKKAEMTDTDIEKAIQDRFDARQKALDVQKKYFKKFKEILNAKQLQKVFHQPCMNGKMKPGMKNHKMMKRGDKQSCMNRPDCGKCPMQAK